MDDTYWNAEQIKEFVETILEELNLLSSEQATWDEVEERDGPAADGKWQYVINPKKSEFDSNGAKHVLSGPADFERTLTQLTKAGALPVAAHEIEHILQEEYNQQVSYQIPLALARGRRTITIQEAGAIDQERKVQQSFGRERPVNAHYLKAREVKLAGGNKMEVIRAYYNSHIAGKDLDEKRLAASRKIAVGAALRLYRDAGYNSQPLDYLEQELITRSLKQLPEGQAEAIMTAATAFSLRDTAQLHKFGLLELPQSLPLQPAEVVIRVFKEKYLPNILAGVST
jgi:hypothetical protein